MRTLKFTPISLLFFIFVPAASAQKRSWQAVELLPPGTSISVKTESLRTMCTFARATDDELDCWPVPPLQPPYRPWPLPPPLPVPYPQPPSPEIAVFKREFVREVRLEHSVATNILIGTAIGGGAGVAIGASDHGPHTRGAAMLLGGIFGGLIGGLFGRALPVFHRKVIYKRR